MTLREIITRLGRRTPTICAALCTARASALLGRYPAGEEHIILAMIQCEACDVENAVTTLLESHGWRDVLVEESQPLEVPFFTRDREVRACYVSAVTSDGGLIVYGDTEAADAAREALQRV